jgi:hypothetical protein
MRGVAVNEPDEFGVVHPDVRGSRMLDKMANDQWDNAVKLLSGEWFISGHCVVRGDWVEFSWISESHGFPDYIANSWGFGRGLEVRIDSIAWIVEQDS